MSNGMKDIVVTIDCTNTFNWENCQFLQFNCLLDMDMSVHSNIHLSTNTEDPDPCRHDYSVTCDLS